MTANPRSDEDLIRSIKEGDMDSFTELVRRYERPILNFFYYLSSDRAFSEDLAQEVFMRVYKGLKSYHFSGRFAGFLFTIARNLWIDQMRRKHPENVYSLSSDDDSQNPIDTLAVDGQNPSQHELKSVIKTALLKLPEDQRLVVILAHLNGFTYNEVSRILGIPVGTIKSRMHSAVQTLRNLLSKYKES